MKKIIVVLMMLVAIPLTIFAVEVENGIFSVQQKSFFASYARVTQNDFAVPTLVDVPLTFDDDVLQEIVVVTDDQIVPSTIINDIEQLPLVLTITDSFNGNDRTMVDDDLETFRELPFIEEQIIEEHVTSVTDEYDRESRLQEKKVLIPDENSVVFDVRANRLFNTDSFTLYFDDHVSRPTHVRVAAFDSNGNEQILLSEKLFTQDTVYFPPGNSDHFQITLKYAKPLRIVEMVFHEKGIPEKTQRFVRFIAQPQSSYDIYYNTYEHVQIDRGEQPNFSQDKAVDQLTTEFVKNNPLYKKADSDKDGIIDSNDNCVNIRNADQIDKDQNGVGDACEDFDRDGIINAKDNCPLETNRSQADSDYDGIGDVCDEEESRFMEQNPWIPYFALVTVFGVVGALTVITLKKK